jgi:hypothetical protein
MATFSIKRTPNTQLAKVSQIDLNKTKINPTDYFKARHLKDVNNFPERVRPVST